VGKRGASRRVRRGGRERYCTSLHVSTVSVSVIKRTGLPKGYCCFLFVATGSSSLLGLRLSSQFSYRFLPLDLVVFKIVAALAGVPKRHSLMRMGFWLFSFLIDIFFYVSLYVAFLFYTRELVLLGFLFPVSFFFCQMRVAVGRFFCCIEFSLSSYT